MWNSAGGAARLLCAVAVFAAGVAPAAADEAARSYTLAVVPSQLPVAVYRDWTPLVERLSQRLGVKVEIKIYRTIPRFEAELQRGVPDFAFMNPYHQVMAHKAQGYVPLVRSSHPLTGIVVVRKDSAARSVKDLDGQTLAFPAPNAFGASLYMRALLIERVKIRFNSYYVDAHNEVYRQVILGEAAAGGGVSQTFNREPPEVRAQLRVLYETPETTSHPLSAHPRVPAAVRKAVQQIVLEMGANAAGRKLLDDMQLAEPVEADYRRDYLPLKKLGLEKHVAVSD